MYYVYKTDTTPNTQQFNARFCTLSVINMQTTQVFLCKLFKTVSEET